MIAPPLRLITVDPKESKTRRIFLRILNATEEIYDDQI
jgi:hypothetical protein